MVFIRIIVTFLVAYFVSTSLELLYFIFSGSTYLIIFLLEIGIAIYLRTRIHKMSSSLAKELYIGYSALTGLTFSSIFIIYEISSIIWIFLASAIVFLIFSFLGKSDRFDLNHYGIYLLDY